MDDEEMQHGLTALEAGRLDEAAAAFTRCTLARPDDYNAWLYLGIARDELGIHKGAVDAFTTCTRLDPTLPYAWANLGIMHLKRSDLLEAQRHLVKAKQIDPFDTTVRLNLGIVYLKLRNKMLEALGEFEHVLDVEPGNIEAWFHLGTAFMELGQRGHAMSCFEAARKHGLHDEMNDKHLREMKFDGVAPLDPFDPARREQAFHPFKKDIAT